MTEHKRNLLLFRQFRVLLLLEIKNFMVWRHIISGEALLLEAITLERHLHACVPEAVTSGKEHQPSQKKYPHPRCPI
jgi:hypothetical protein